MKKTKAKNIVTYKYKVYGNERDFKRLDTMAYHVNIVWNYLNDLHDKVYSDWNFWDRQGVVSTLNKKTNELEYTSENGRLIPYIDQDGKLDYITSDKGCIKDSAAQRLLAGT